MTTRPARLLAGILLTLLTALTAITAAAGPASASALPIGQCTTSSGVILAVDFSHWGGPLLRSCGTTPTSGYTLLNQGGWATTGTGHDGPAFICRIGYSGYQGGTQYPTPKQDSCVLTPPASAYWSYWHADPGQNSWSYSQLGAMSYHPKPGSVDLWIFGGTNIAGTEGRPTITPDAVRAHNTTGTGTHTTSPKPTTAPTPKAPALAPPTAAAAGPAPSSSGSAPAASPSSTPATSASGSASADASSPPSQTAGAAVPGSSGSASPGPQIVNAAPAANAPHSSGSFLPAAIAAILVIGFGSGAIVTARHRRRRADQ